MSLAATAVLQAHPVGPGGARPAVATVDTRTPDGHTIRCHSRRRGAAVNRRIAAAAFATLAVPAWAGRIIVNPGPGTPVQNAINASGPGDVVKLNPGTYPESITVTKPLKIYGKDATIDAGCGVMTAVQISADAVSLRSLTVRGGNFYTIDTTGRDRTVIDLLLARDDLEQRRLATTVGADQADAIVMAEAQRGRVEDHPIREEQGDVFEDNQAHGRP